jgi:peptidoglycan/xylan/chitin deacetylase (PgdA/CDA1 family)
VILEPNRRRRNRVFRAVVGVVALLFVGGLLASGWTLPAFSIASGPTAPPPPAPTPSTGPVAIVPTPVPTTEPSPTPQPTPGADGCIPPPADLKPAEVVSHGSRKTKVVALTFDDGYDAPNVERILRFLVSHQVNATFFPTAAAVQMAPKTWQKVAAAGFPIGNHTFHHASLKGVCYEKQLAELTKAKSIVAEQALPMQGYMRPPYEEFDMNTRRAAASAGEAYVVLWDIDTFDWTGVSKGTISSRALKGKSGSIILMHTSPHATPAALVRIVEKFRGRGYSFVTVGQLLGVPGPAPYPAPTPTP